MAREINLVPDIKNEMIKALKLRNFIFFLCIVVASASIGITVATGVIMGGQQLVVDSKKGTINNLSSKLNSYNDLGDFLTIKDQLGNISTTTGDKKVLSRTFNILAALLPTGADTIKISELSVNLTEDTPVYSFDAQANAGKEPFIDYNVLDAFKKSMKYMRYDYGKYVDKEGNNIPAYCMVETSSDGATLKDVDKGYYAYWTINGEGCNPSDTLKADSYTTEDYEGQTVVRVWRTPQFNEWYKTNEVSGEPYMSLDGEIKNVPHFESSCITYSGDDSNDPANPKWTETNEECLLIPDGEEGISIFDSSNGRSGNDELVLRFSASIAIAPEVYNFNNTHAMAIGPSGRRNVTDSYVQVQAMFSERAVDCTEGDTTCSSAPTTGTNSDTTNNTDSTTNNTSSNTNNSSTNGGNNG